MPTPRQHQVTLRGLLKLRVQGAKLEKIRRHLAQGGDPAIIEKELEELLDDYPHVLNELLPE